MTATTPNDTFAALVSEIPAQAERDELQALRDKAQEVYTARYEAALKARYPRRKKGQELDHETLEAIRESVLEEFPRIPELEKLVARLDDEHQVYLRMAAAEYVFTPDASRPSRGVKVASESSYRSQTQPGFYARGELLPLARSLESKGYKATVMAYGPDQWGLWSNATPLDVRAAELVIDDRFRLSVWKQSGHNPRVYNPWLTWD